MKAQPTKAISRLPALKFFDTGHGGLAVFATSFLEVEAIVREYAGHLREYATISAPKRELGEGKCGYFEGLTCGFITRFMSRACEPNVAFGGMQNRTTVKVLEVIIQSMKAGTHLTLNYGEEI
ncbi:Set domain-containing hypothetical protein [Phytophthora megakarya]|uniref:SET domain-containing protein n=1 Tax=Phytophthora megakarya TaxID=4795 RepID=A0A225WKW8_9STRA|nr:Set domain-containing hypothetical protein [Phytophthora megakarya]